MTCSVDRFQGNDREQWSGWSETCVSGVCNANLGPPSMFLPVNGLLYGVAARDPITMTAVSLLLVGAVLLACYGPTRRATTVDPMTSLRHE